MKKKFLSIILSLSLTTPSYASIQSFIENNIGGSMQVTDSGYYKTQVGGYYTLGGVRIRWGDMGAIYPFHAQAPKINVGCNGVDITWGGFGYLDFNYLVDKLKKITSVAPAFAFYTAITTLCQQCGTIMDNLEKIADQINSLNFDACKVLKGMQGAIHNYLVKSGYTDNPINARAKEIADGLGTISTYLSQVQKFLNADGLEGAKNQFAWGSLLAKAMSKYSGAITMADFESIMRALLGDVYGYTFKSQNVDGSDNTSINKLMFITPVISVNDFFKFLEEGGELNSLKITDNKDGNIYLQPNVTSYKVKLNPNSSIVSYYKNRIIELIKKIKEKNTLTDYDLNFLNQVPYPLYKIINIQATLGDNSAVDNVAKLMAYESIKALINYYLKNMRMTLLTLTSNPDFQATYSDEAKKYIKLLNKRISNLNELLSIKITSLYTQLNSKVKVLNYFQNLEKQMVERSPIWRANSF